MDFLNDDNVKKHRHELGINKNIVIPIDKLYRLKKELGELNKHIDSKKYKHIEKFIDHVLIHEGIQVFLNKVLTTNTKNKTLNKEALNKEISNKDFSKEDSSLSQT